jgi:hypothetical protein
LGSKRAEEFSEEKVEQEAAANMPEDIREMVPVTFGVPDQVIENVRDVLERPIVTGVGVRKEVMAECFQNEQRTFDKWIVPGQIKVIPEKLSLEGRNVNAGAKQNEHKTP